MAAALPAIDLQTASLLTRIPYGTLTRWAHETPWLPERKVGRKLFYAWEDVERAVAARQSRTKAAA